MKRKLASIQKIEALAPIENADNIAQAKVMGWTVVVKKGEFVPGDRCVFFEVDAVLPEGRPWAEFMRPRAFRVKTAKLRGVLSQGLALPLDILPGEGGRDLELGADVTETLGVVKYEPPVPESIDAAGPFPAMIPKTDEIRLQSALAVIEELRGSPFFITVKCDGTSSTYAKHEGALLVCSRGLSLKRSNNHYWTIADQYELEKKLPEGFAVQGEICGPGIQKNRLGLARHELFIFSAFDIRAGKYLDFQPFQTFCRDLGLRTVPLERVVDGESLAGFDYRLENFLELAKGTYAGTKSRREGIVIRPLIEAPSATLAGRLSFKVLNNDFLLKDEE